MALKWVQELAVTTGVGILLQEAIDELITIGNELGFSPPRRREDTVNVQTEIALAREYLAPLVIPEEILDFWAWDANSFALLDAADLKILSPTVALKEVEFMDGLEFPGVLLPIAREEKRLLTVELCSDTHPGMRLFELGFHGENLSMFGIGVSDMIEMFSEAIDLSTEQGNPGEWGGRIMDWDMYNIVTSDRFETHGAISIDPFEKTQWQEHWLTAAGFTPEWLEPRGPTMSIAEFDAVAGNQIGGESVSAVLHGVWQLKAGGGDLGGTIGTLTDDSGTIAVFVPSDCPHGGLGPDRRCEIEIQVGDGLAPDRRASPDTYGGLGDPAGSTIAGRSTGPLALATAVRPLFT